ncbi:MAG: HAMP domain-containing histidine kinase [Bradyrhizobiaceae bacterium]|nr:MAG: HAMP domain-containing histidine kinase [Bradyrhizobiaceae bacterium]
MSSERDDKRTIEILERKCTALQAELDTVKIEQANYLQNISHQLVAPLNAIKWHIENLTSGRMTNIDRAKKVMRSVYSQSTIAVHLAKNFALMSNLEGDHALTALKEPLQPVSLCRLAINLADDFQPLGWDKEIDIAVDKTNFETASEVLVMKPLINQVLSNVIENAVKYSNPGSKILIGGKYNKDHDSVSVVIRNHGIPLPAQVADVFKRGYRSDSAKNKYPAGTGFGLFIAKRIVEIHEGTISAQMLGRDEVVFTITLSVRGLEGKARFREPKNRSSRR